MLDLLRCVKPHDDTWLVASFTTVSNRFVQAGKLGCPSCGASYLIEDGIADFSLGEVLPACEAERASASHRREELATRAGAYLDATQAGATILLGGVWAYAAQELTELTGVRVLALNAPSAVRESETVSLLRVASEIPVAPGSAYGIALDAWFPKAILASALKAVRPGGRIVGPASFEALPELTVLAHDDRYWVGEKPQEIVALHHHRASRVT